MRITIYESDAWFATRINGRVTKEALTATHRMGRSRVAAPPSQIKIKKHRLRRRNNIRLLCDVPFSRNQPLKLTDDWYVGILKRNKNRRRMSPLRCDNFRRYITQCYLLQNVFSGVNFM